MAELTSVKQEDFLEQDPSIRNQNFFCVSFISPEDVIQAKEVYFFHKFLSCFAKDLNEFFDLTSEKYKDDKQTVEMLGSIRERYDYLFNPAALGHEFNHYKEMNTKDLEQEYHEKNNFQTTMRGIKMRGCYDTYKEAKNRAEQIKKFDPAFNVFVGQVGCWCPWSPQPEDIEDQEYAETQLNTLMKKYKEGQDIKNELYKLRKNELIEKVKMHKIEEKTSDTIKEEEEQ